MVYNNLRFTNWKRAQGCRCQTLKKVVDWCGCSPLALLHTEEKVNLNRTITKVNYFARKFESLIDVESIASAERQVLRFEPNKLQKQSVVFNSTWVNFYDRRFDNGNLLDTCQMICLDNSTRTAYTLLSNALYNNFKLNNACEFGDLLQIHVYKANIDSKSLLLFHVVDACGIEYELLVECNNQGDIIIDEHVEGYELKLIEYGAMLDLKEEIFRDFVAMVHRVS